MTSLSMDPANRYMIAAQEDRCAPRIRLTIPASLRVSGARGFQTAINDLSVAGFCASAIARIHPGTVCWLSIPGLESLQAEVVWWNNCQVGCSFHTMLSPIVHDDILARWRGDSAFRSVP